MKGPLENTRVGGRRQRKRERDGNVFLAQRRSEGTNNTGIVFETLQNPKDGGQVKEKMACGSNMVLQCQDLTNHAILHNDMDLIQGQVDNYIL